MSHSDSDILDMELVKLLYYVIFLFVIMVGLNLYAATFDETLSKGYRLLSLTASIIIFVQLYLNEFRRSQLKNIKEVSNVAQNRKVRG